MKDHTNDINLDIEGWHPTKQIVTKRSRQNIITTLHGTYISKVEEGCNDDDETMTSTFFMRQLRPQIIVITMSLNPKIQIMPMVILLGHESQRLHNHKQLAFCNTYTKVKFFMQIHMVA
jgi:hypothetical protein